MDEYRQSATCIYRRTGTTNEVLTPWGWTLACFLLGQRGWQLILWMTEPVPVNPAWPA